MKKCQHFKIFFLTLLAVCLLLQTVSAQRLDKFGSISHQIAGNKIPYPQIKTYFGYVETDSISSYIHNEKKFYFLYFGITDTIQEMGIRLISPVPDVLMPDKGDLVTENYFDNEKDKKNYFDPYLKIEKALDYKTTDFLKPDTAFRWMLLGSNDDAAELFAQPDGKSNNSLLRIVSHTDTTGKMLLPGLYRIAFTDFKNQSLQGSYVIQLGTTGKIFEGKLTTSKEELYR